MVVLYAANLGNIPRATYNWDCGEISCNKLEDALEHTRENYSENLVNILERMLEIEEDLRCDPATL